VGGGAFIPIPALTTVVGENVSGFTVDLSADRGANWVTGVDNWPAVTVALDAQLAKSGAPGFTSVASSPHWYRSVSLLMRVNVTTRTTQPRTEYSTSGNALAYKQQTQTLVLQPRHFGLSF
jgi:hypothetical protein